MPDPIVFGGLMKMGESIIQRIWPDPAKQAEEMRKLQELEQKGDLAELQAHVDLMVGQLEINKIEAAHPSIFVAGWRPAVGWVAAISLALAYIPKSIAITILWIWQNARIIQQTTDAEIASLELTAFPDLGTGEIFGLLGSMLGIGIMRSVDKFNRTDTKSTQPPKSKNWFRK